MSTKKKDNRNKSHYSIHFSPGWTENDRNNLYRFSKNSTDGCRNMQNPDVKFFMRKRYFVCFWTCVGYIFLYILRSNLSIALVEMTSERKVTLENGTDLKKPAEFTWGSEQKGFILSLFSYGYYFAPLGGFLTLHFGGVTMYGIGVTGTALLTVASPYLLRIHFMLFAGARILEGVFESFSAVALLNVFILWAPPHERSRLVLLGFVGAYVGIFVNYWLCGYIAAKWGYEAIFTVTGGGALAWYVIWLLFISNNPITDQYITDNERNYFRNFIRILDPKKKQSYPWKTILTSKPAWAIFNEHFCYSWFYSFTGFCLPLYVKDVFNVDVQTVGLISGIPILGGIIGITMWSFIADYLRSNGILRVATVHRIFIGIGQISCAIFLLVIGFWTNFFESIVCFFLLRLLTGAADVSYLVIFIDVFGEYTAVVKGIATMFTNTGLLLNPTIMGFLVSDHNRSSWNLYFILISIFNIFSLFVFYKYGSGEPQEWATHATDEKVEAAPEEQNQN